MGIILAGCGNGGASSTTAGAQGGSTTPPTASGGGSTVQVVMKNISYQPATVTVKVGDTVTWVNEDQTQHDVVADNGEFKSNLLNKGESFSFSFTKGGTYPYYCSIHPNMHGTVTVQ